MPFALRFWTTAARVSATMLRLLRESFGVGRCLDCGATSSERFCDEACESRFVVTEAW